MSLLAPRLHLVKCALIISKSISKPMVVLLSFRTINLLCCLLLDQRVRLDQLAPEVQALVVREGLAVLVRQGLQGSLVPVDQLGQLALPVTQDQVVQDLIPILAQPALQDQQDQLDRTLDQQDQQDQLALLVPPVHRQGQLER